MQYLRVQWLHENPKEPIWLYSELDEDRWEIRKVEVFRDGTKGYASPTESDGRTFLGTLPVPALNNIGADPQFVPQEISKEDFEFVWEHRWSPSS
jgi:hypothetical protein